MNESILVGLLVLFGGTLVGLIGWLARTGYLRLEQELDTLAQAHIEKIQRLTALEHDTRALELRVEHLEHETPQER